MHTRHEWYTIIAGLSILALALVVPVAATDHILNPGDSIQENITDASNFDTIILNPGVYYQNSITAYKSITIRAADGHGAWDTFIDAQSSGRIFSVFGPNTLTVENLTLQNGDTSNYDGGAINGSSTTSTVTVRNTTITNCRANKYGGALASYAVNIYSSNLTNCWAGSTGGTITDYGGGINIIDTTIDASSVDSEFGGALYITGGTIADSTITNSMSHGFGGAICHIVAGSLLTISNSTIDNCWEDKWGFVSDEDNSGGAIYDRVGIIITDTTIANCTASFGGALWADGSATITNSTFINNTGRIKGGAILINEGTVTNSTFINCSTTHLSASEDYGGAIFIHRGNVTDTTITNCSAGNGGAIFSTNSHITNVTATHCSATNNGGAIYIGSATVTNSTITNSSATNNGGAIYIDANDIDGNGIVHFSRIYGNTATTGNAVYRAGGTIDLAYNWWGQNDGPLDGVSGSSAYTPWLRLGAIASPSSITPAGTSEVRANLTYDSAGTYHDPTGFHVPDGIPVKFTRLGGSGGNLLPLAGNMTSGMNATTLSLPVIGISTVRVTVDNQSVDALVYVETNLPPEVISISPVTGLNTSATQVRITGRNFNTVTSPTVNLTRDGYSNVTLDVVSDSESLLVRNVPAYLTAGAWNVSVANSNGDEGTNASVTFTAVVPPVVTGINPMSGANISEMNVEITGRDLNTVTPPTVNLTRDGYSNVTLGVVSGTSTLLIRTIPAYLTAGVWNVTVVNPEGEGTNASVTFTVTAPPVVTGISPAGGTNATTTPVTITGMNFNATTSPTVNLTRDGYSNVTLDVVSDTSTLLVRTVPAYLIAGAWNVTVVNPNGEEDSNPSVTFTVTDLPVVTGITPTEGINTSATLVTITGMNFNATTSPTVNLTRSGYANVTLTGTNISRGSLDITIPANEIAGIWNVIVVNPGGEEGTNSRVTFTVIEGSSPTLTPTSTPAPIPTQTTASDSSSSEGSIIVSKPGTTAVTVADAGDVPAGSTVILNFFQVPASSADPPTVEEVTVTTADSLTSLEVTAMPVPQYVSSSPLSGRTVAGYLSVTPVDVEEAGISKGTITFVVNADWLEGHNLKISDVALMRYHDGTWTSLPTTYDGRTGTGYYFTATTPGFSYFAVTFGNNTKANMSSTTAVETTRSGDVLIASVTTVPKAAFTYTRHTTAPVTTKITAVPAVAPAPALPDTGFPLATVALIGAGCVVLAGGGWWVRRWWIRRQNPALFEEY
ncbi:MAG: PGF-pre-PGF domain-containing protein [Methanoregula sp.]|nr:PGF-pre-PGF domain-containing protein [Methanoregula sp.]